MEILTAEQRWKGLQFKTPLDALPADITPEWAEARAALETAYDALDAYDGEHDDLLSEHWKQSAERREKAYVAAIQAGSKPPARPRGGYVAEAEDKRPAVVGEWFKLCGAKTAADKAAWEVLVRTAPQAIPDAHAAIEAAGEALIAAEEAAAKARQAFEQAFAKRKNLEQFARDTDLHTGVGGLPTSVHTNSDGQPYPATLMVPLAIKWLTQQYGPADTGTRLPTMRRVRSKTNGAEFDMTPAMAWTFETSANTEGIEYIDGYPPESELRRNAASRVQVEAV